MVRSDYYPFGLKMNVGVYEKYRYSFQANYAENDEETGFNHFELRDYDPVIGRWMRPDPYRQYASPYMAMGNRPTSVTDPDGGCADDDYDCWRGAYEAGIDYDALASIGGSVEVTATRMKGNRAINTPRPIDWPTMQTMWMGNTGNFEDAWNEFAKNAKTFVVDGDMVQWLLFWSKKGPTDKPDKTTPTREEMTQSSVEAGLEKENPQATLEIDWDTVSAARRHGDVHGNLYLIDSVKKNGEFQGLIATPIDWQGNKTGPSIEFHD